jgi:rRNA processing protein Krr1/Pno1
MAATTRKRSKSGGRAAVTKSKKAKAAEKEAEAEVEAEVVEEADKAVPAANEEEGEEKEKEAKEEVEAKREEDEKDVEEVHEEEEEMSSGGVEEEVAHPSPINDDVVVDPAVVEMVATEENAHSPDLPPVEEEERADDGDEAAAGGDEVDAKVGVEVIENEPEGVDVPSKLSPPPKDPTSTSAFPPLDVTDAVNAADVVGPKRDAPATTTTSTTVPRATAAAPAATTTTTTTSSSMSGGGDETTIEERGAVSATFVGRVIGKGGEMIRDLQARSGCRIDVDQNVPSGAPRIITYRGTRACIDFAKQLVSLLCVEKTPGVKEAELPLGRASVKSLQIPGNVIGKIIGRGGEMIRKLQNESGAKIQVDHSMGQDADHRLVTITGNDESIHRAEEMMMFLCANPAMDSGQAIEMLIRDKMFRGGGGGGSAAHDGGYGQMMGQPQAYPSNQYGPPGGPALVMGGGGVGVIETEIFPCAKMFMGRIIGQRGVTINDLQKRSGCDIQTKQNVPAGQDCQISLKGSRRGIDMAKQMLREIIDLGPNHPYAGGREFPFFQLHVDFYVVVILSDSVLLPPAVLFDCPSTPLMPQNVDRWSQWWRR